MMINNEPMLFYYQVTIFIISTFYWLRYVKKDQISSCTFITCFQLTCICVSHHLMHVIRISHVVSKLTIHIVCVNCIYFACDCFTR